MSLEKKFIRDGRNRVIGSVTAGYSDESAVVRDEDGQLLGRTSDKFDTTRDAHGNLVSINSAEAGYLIPILFVPEDVAYLRRIQSPLLEYVRDFGSEARKGGVGNCQPALAFLDPRIRMQGGATR